MNPIDDLVLKLEDAAAVGAINLYHRALCTQVAAAIRQLQQGNAKAALESQAAFCDNLAEAFTRLSRGMRGHA